jgi:putative transposase
VADILITGTDGLKGMAEAQGAVFPATTRQTCIVRLIAAAAASSTKDRMPGPKCPASVFSCSKPGAVLGPSAGACC